MPTSSGVSTLVTGHIFVAREAQLGATLEEACANRDRSLANFAGVCGPLERTLAEQPFLAGIAPAYVDYIVFSVFQWARISSPRDVLPQEGGQPVLPAWRARMVALHNCLGDRFRGLSCRAPRARRKVGDGLDLIVI